MAEHTHSEKGPLLNTLQAGERFIGFYLIDKKQLEPYRDTTKGHYLSLVLKDRSSKKLARIWENAEEADQVLAVGEVIKVDGEAEKFNDRIQIRLFQFRAAKPGEFEWEDMLPSSPRPLDEMMLELKGYLKGVNHPQLKELLDYFFKNQAFLTDFCQAPASKQIHHAYRHGLLEHTLEILRLAETTVSLYPQLNDQLLYTGILLHDIGKLRELEWYLSTDYSTEGELLGHVLLSNEMLETAFKALKAFPPELALQIKHMVASHHGRYEWGSPRRPKTLEAIALHQLENASVQVNRFAMLLDESGGGEEWTSFDTGLKRRLYRTNEDGLSVEERSQLD